MTVDLRESLWAGWGEEDCFAIWMACNSCSSFMILITSRSPAPPADDDVEDVVVPVADILGE